jgi:hypothetical protein
MGKKMITYKGTDQDMKCHGGFQYELGKKYEDDGAIRCGGSGYHSCKVPLDVFQYFAPNKSQYFICEAGGIVDEDNKDSKIASSELILKAEIGIPGLVKAHIDYVKSHTTTEHTDPERATAGDCGAATAGDYGAATAGDYGAATSRGSVTVGANGAGLVRSNDVKIRGGLGAILVIAEEKENSYDLTHWKTVVVDGETVKADTWYKLVDGELVEAEQC